MQNLEALEETLSKQKQELKELSAKLQVINNYFLGIAYVKGLDICSALVVICTAFTVSFLSL